MNRRRGKAKLPGLPRRDFLTQSAGSLIVTSAGPLLAEPAASLESPDSQRTPWYSSMRRCGQINFNERDPLAMDVTAWADYWASLKVNAVLLNGGAIAAFYPTPVAYHYRSALL